MTKTKQINKLIDRALKLDEMLNKLKSRVWELDEIEGSKLDDLLENN